MFLQKMSSKHYSLVIWICGLTLFIVEGFYDNFWSPFLPTEFTERGLSETTTGIIIAAYDIACLLTPVLILGVKDFALNEITFCLAAFSQGIFSIIFGALMLIRSNVCFVLMCLLIRCLMGIGYTVLWCSGAKIFLFLFPDNPGKVFSSISSSVSIGLILGTPYGSFIYGISGYYPPFIIIGGIQMILAVINYLNLFRNVSEIYEEDRLLGDQENIEKVGVNYCNEKESNTTTNLLTSNQTTGDHNISVLEFLTNRGVLAVSLQFTAYTSTVGFFFVSYAPYLLNTFQVSSEDAGLYILPFTLVRTVTAPIFGYFTDIGFGGFIFAVISGVLGIPSLLMLGIAGLDDSLTNIYLAEVLISVMGISSIACYVNIIPLMRKMYQGKVGVSIQTVETYATAICCVCYGSGMVFGQSVIGGFVLQNFGFNNSCFVEIAVLATANTIVLTYLVKNRLLYD